eukprot:scaffold26271_cov40-Cyclotella_meneghiniana.AAC.2
MLTAIRSFAFHRSRTPHLPHEDYMLPAGKITSALLSKKIPKNSEPVVTVRSERLDCAYLFVFGMRDEKAKKAILGSIENTHFNHTNTLSAIHGLPSSRSLQWGNLKTL